MWRPARWLRGVPRARSDLLRHVTISAPSSTPSPPCRAGAGDVQLREVALICVADPRPTLKLPHGFDLVKDKTVLQVNVFLSRSRRLVHRSVRRDSKGSRE